MQQFPWVQYLTTLLFYLVIAVAVYFVGSALPRTIEPQMTAEQLQSIEQQQSVERTKLVYQQVLAAVGKLMVLPNAIPQISVVSDVAAFVQQNPVFAGVQSGDILLIYPNQIIVYSPKYNRIVHSVPYSQSQQSPSLSSGTTGAVDDVSVDIQP
jgi:hypothetical protein